MSAEQMQAVADLLDQLEVEARREGRPYLWSPAQVVRDYVSAHSDTGKEDGERLDKARLDWLDRNCPSYSVGRTMNAPESPDPMPFAFKYGLGSRVKTILFRGGVRHAIDAAMRGDTKIVDPFPPLYAEAAAHAATIERCEHGHPKAYICPKCDAAQSAPNEGRTEK
jgi:hypothetical protein